MKDVIERMFLMTTDEVLELFLNLPGAVEGDNYIYIPGTKETRVLLVGHADTVFANPPKSVEWSGNMAKAGFSETKDRRIEHKITRTRKVAQKQSEPPKPAPKPANVQRQVVNDAITVTLGDRVMTIAEFEQLKKEGKLPQPRGLYSGYGYVGESGSNYSYQNGKSYSNNAANALHNNKRKQGYPAGLGADDRAGLAMIWLLRKLGHSILITDLEEIGGVGAREAGQELAALIREHQFAIEIDRNGDQEMVFYDVSTPEFENYMWEVTGGFAINRGSYTDIKDVCKAGGICGVNIAAGYLFQHSDREMFFYDFWLRTYKVLHKLLSQKEPLPRFELPKAVPAASSPPKALPAASSTSGQGSTGSRRSFEEMTDEELHEYLAAKYPEYAERRARQTMARTEQDHETFAESGAKDQRTPIHLLADVEIELAHAEDTEPAVVGN